MSDPPPPTNPPPGWYPDPAGGPDHRWWDGRSWTEAVGDSTGSATTTAASWAPSPIGGVGPWLSDSVRSAVGRSGHFLPMILFFVLTLSIPSSYAIWYALRDTVLTFDPDTGLGDISYGGSEGWLFVASAGIPLAIVASYIMKAAVIHHIRAVKDDEPEPWSVSVNTVLQRSGRVVGFSLLRSAMYWALLAVVVFGTALSPGFILVAPFVGGALFFLWIRLAFVGSAAALADRSVNPLAESWRLSGGHFWSLSGRLFLLAILAFNLILAFGILAAPFTAIAGGATDPIENSSEVIRFNELMGPNPSVFALGSVFNALGLGANYVLAAVGTTLLYRNLGGASATADPSPSDGREAE